MLKDGLAAIYIYNLMIHNFSNKLFKDIRNNKIISSKSKILAFTEFYDYYRTRGEEPPTMEEIEEVEENK